MTRPSLPWYARLLLRAVPDEWRDEVQAELAALGARARRERGRWSRHRVLVRESLDFALRYGWDGWLEAQKGAWNATEWRMAVRSLRRFPAVTVLTFVTLSVAMTVAGAAFHLVRELAFSAPPYPEAERVIDIEVVDRVGGFPLHVSLDDVATLRRGLSDVTLLGAWASRSEMVHEPGGALSSRRVVFVTPEVMEVLGVGPLRGALPTLAGVRQGGASIVLPYGLWEDWFDGAPDVLGRTVRIGDVVHQVAAVMPPGFGFPYGEHLWVTLDPAEAGAVGLDRVRVVGRLADGAGPAAVEVRLRALDLESVSSDEALVRVVPAGRAGNSAVPALLLWGVVAGLAALLLVMASNVGNLVLARNLRRSKEFAVRSALGASRGRVVAGLFLEGALLVAPAAAASVYLMATLVPRTFGRLDDLPIWVDPRPDALTFGVLGVLTVGVTVVLGLIPAFGTTRGLGSSLRAAGVGSPGRAFGRRARAVVTAQLVLAVGFLATVLTVGRALTGAGGALAAVPEDRVVIAQIYFGWPESLQDGRAVSPAERDSIVEEFEDGLRVTYAEMRSVLEADRAVEQVVFASRWPGNESLRVPVAVDGGGTAPAVELFEIEAGYHDVLGARPLAGRSLDERDLVEGAPPVAMVNEPFARAFLPPGGAVGATLRVDGRDDVAYTVVGVVPDLGVSPGTSGAAPGLYVPLSPTNVVRIGLVHRGERSAATAALFTHAATRPDRIRIQWTKSLEAQAREPVVVLWGLGGLILGLGAFALVLSAASLHAMTSFMVTARTREIGVRVALGGTSGQVVWLVIRQAVGVGVAGALGGLVLANLLLSVLRSVPWFVDEEPVAGAMALAALLAASLAAAVWLPLRRALGVEPAGAMRAE
ncbi:MAG: ABC transporter permease [Longimicrobiales bacterium]